MNIIKKTTLPFLTLMSSLFQGEVLKQNRNSDPRARLVLPSVNDPGVLVLQGVKKAARGNYSCRVGNGVPTYSHVVESEPIFLDVKCEFVDVSIFFEFHKFARVQSEHSRNLSDISVTSYVSGILS